jgi:phosphoglycerol transferase MdoB-like AlkP superfamily enzyme
MLHSFKNVILWLFLHFRQLLLLGLPPPVVVVDVTVLAHSARVESVVLTEPRLFCPSELVVAVVAHSLRVVLLVLVAALVLILFLLFHRLFYQVRLEARSELALFFQVLEDQQLDQVLLEEQVSQGLIHLRLWLGRDLLLGHVRGPEQSGHLDFRTREGE